MCSEKNTRLPKSRKQKKFEKTPVVGLSYVEEQRYKKIVEDADKALKNVINPQENSNNPPVTIVFGPPGVENIPKTQDSAGSSLPKKSRSIRGYGFLFTDYSLDYNLLKEVFERPSPSCLYIVFGREQCPTTGRIHFQGYMYFENEVSRDKLRKDLQVSGGFGYVELARDTARKNRLYCIKGVQSHEEWEAYKEKGPNWFKTIRDGVSPQVKDVDYWEFGECPKGQGHRSDLETAHEDIMEGKCTSMRQLYEQHGAVVHRAPKSLAAMIEEFRPRRNWMTELIIIIGPAGAGKSELARNEGAEEISLSGDYKMPFLMGYSGNNPIILIDEFDPNQIAINVFLRLIDKGDFICNVKNGTMHFNAKRVYVTANKSLDKWWPSAPDEQMEALKRRITDLVYFEAPVGRVNPVPRVSHIKVDYTCPQPESGPQRIVEKVQDMTDEEWQLILKLRADRLSGKKNDLPNFSSFLN